MEWHIRNILAMLRQIWEFELYGSGGVTIHLNQVVIAFLIIILGGVASKRISGMIGNRLNATGRLKSNAAFMIQRIIFYLLLVIATLIALPIAGIPITVFTVIGGALAIGIGFGAQNLFNNLMSGIIIMLEQPIRIGDVIELEEQEGRVQNIGNRCVRVRRTDGVDVLVPNSHFLEQQVVNWTLFDNAIRGSVRVGVAYGSPTDKVAAIIEKIASRHPEILSRPEPARVLFEDFGDSALVFNLLFWTQVLRPMDLRVIQSDLRFQIDAAFREDGIVIAFPQQDVHLDSLRPIDVRVVRDAAR